MLCLDLFSVYMLIFNHNLNFLVYMFLLVVFYLFGHIVICFVNSFSTLKYFQFLFFLYVLD